MEGLSVASLFEPTLELGVTQFNSFNPVSTSERLSLLETLMSQEKLSDLLQSFAAWLSRHLPVCRMSYVWMEQRIEAFNQRHGNYRQSFPLHDLKMQLLGEIDYELSERLSAHQQRMLQQLHQILIKPLKLFLRMEEMDQMCRMDHLTGVGNRAYFDEAMDIAIEQNTRQPNGLTLMLLDLDKFKQINDCYGHPVGDAVLKMFADVMSKSVRGTDMVFRLGGDEFAILFQPADDQTATCVYDRIKTSLANHKGLSQWNTECSIGFMNWEKGMSSKTLYLLADQNLYKNKQLNKEI